MSTAGRFKQLVKLGEGTYGSVYKGTEINTGKVVAFKRMVVQSADEGVPGAAIREICLLKELRHNNVVDLFEVLFEPPKITMIFELCDYDLRRYMDSRPGRSLDVKTEVRPILKQIFLGLDYLHRNNVVHRDMKPQNIFVNVRAPDFAALTSSSPAAVVVKGTGAEQGANRGSGTNDGPSTAGPPAANRGRSEGSASPWEETTGKDAPDQLIVKIGDFGLARVEGIPVKKYSHEVVTLWYRSPDVLMGSALYSFPVDIWSMGAIFFETVTNDVLFTGRNEEDQVLRIFWLLGSPTTETWPSMLSYPGTKDRLDRTRRAAMERFDPNASRDPKKQHSRNNDALATLAVETFYTNPEELEYRVATVNTAANSYGLPLDLWFPRPLFRKFIASSKFTIGMNEYGFDLLLRCLQYEPSQRITAAEAVQHPFLRDVPVHNAGPLDVLMNSLLQAMAACRL